MPQKKSQSGTKKQEQNASGGREFGQVIEPMQAEMASENRGLADDSGQQLQAKKPARKGRKAA